MDINHITPFCHPPNFLLFQGVTNYQNRIILRMQIRILLFFLFLLSVVKTNAQNFVPDSSFERNSGVPLLLSSLNMNGSWHNPTKATPDLFCECDKKLMESSEAQVPRNPMGIQKANTGKCYAGIYLLSHHDYREYIQTQLMSPLKGGVKYELNFYISLSDYSRIAINQMGVCFLKGKVETDNTGIITSVKPIYVHIRNELGMDTVEWHKFTLEYKAKGGEQYLLMGSWDITAIDYTGVKVPKSVQTRINQRAEQDAYYYIDDVSLREYHEPYVAKFDTVVVPKIDTLKPTLVFTNDSTGKNPNVSVVMDKPIILKNVLFETGEAVLLPTSFPELDATADYLIRTPGIKIVVSGHTDNIGSEKQNLELSEKRAKAVLDYLVSKSIDPGRISHKGHGSTQPIADNNTEEGRKQNRRVELVFSK